MAGGVIPLESYIADGFAQTVGDPIFLGILVIVWFLGFTIMQGTRIDAKLVIMVPALLLATAFIPFLGILISLVFAALIYLAIMKLTNR